MTIISPATKQNKGKSHCTPDVRRREGVRIAEQDVDKRDNEQECPNGGVKQEIKINKDEESKGGVKRKRLQTDSKE
jgi:hypothetical protein